LGFQGERHDKVLMDIDEADLLGTEPAIDFVELLYTAAKRQAQQIYFRIDWLRGIFFCG
jgi:hypothetical protein